MRYKLTCDYIIEKMAMTDLDGDGDFTAFAEVVSAFERVPTVQRVTPLPVFTMMPHDGAV